MPFVAACMFCPHRLAVPNQAMGACLRCPKCGNYFTVAPMELVPTKGLAFRLKRGGKRAGEEVTKGGQDS